MPLMRGRILFATVPPPTFGRRPLRATMPTGGSMLDLRFLARRKALASIAVVTMALAIGATTATLAVLSAFLRSSLAVPDPERVVVVSPERELPGRGAVLFSDAYPNYVLLRQVQRSFSSVAVVVQSAASWNDHGEAR